MEKTLSEVDLKVGQEITIEWHGKEQKVTIQAIYEDRIEVV